MEIPLTPMEFARRARRLYANREAVVDGGLRLTYAQFFERCDRWSAALQAMGVKKGDRVAYIAPNTHAHLEAYYAVPQIGAVLVPINYRLLPGDFEYIINHCGAKVVCAHGDYIEAVEGIRSEGQVVSSTSSRWKARARAGSTTRRRWPSMGPRSKSRTLPRAICSPSTTRVGRRRDPRA